MDSYTLGAFAVAVAGILILIWMILRAVTVLSLAHRSDYNFSPLQRTRPIPPPTPPPPVPPVRSDDVDTQINWPERDEP